MESKGMKRQDRITERGESRAGRGGEREGGGEQDGVEAQLSTRPLTHSPNTVQQDQSNRHDLICVHWSI